MTKKHKKKKEPLRPIEEKLNAYELLHKNPTNRLIHFFFVPFFTFSVLGLIWAIPLQFTFLGALKDYFNVASIVIGIVMYLYLKWSPTLSYAMLLSIGLFSFFIVQLEYWEKAGGPAFWMVCLVMLIISWLVLCFGNKQEERKFSLFEDFQYLLIAPLWMWSKLFNRLKIPY